MRSGVQTVLERAASVALVVRDDVSRTLKHPGRLRSLFDAGKVRRWGRHVKRMYSQKCLRADWRPKESQGFHGRAYQSYSEYVGHQRAKLPYLDLSLYDPRFRTALLGRLQRHGLVRREATVLCLAARIGSEVKAFHDLGCFAVGIDLNPGPSNRLVLHGDFHELQFPDASVDVVFTNALDHVFDLDRVEREMRRVLKADGLLIIEAIRGMEEGSGYGGFHEAFMWRTIEDLVGFFAGRGLRVVHRSPTDYPWPGEHLCFRREPA